MPKLNITLSLSEKYHILVFTFLFVFLLKQFFIYFRKSMFKAIFTNYLAL